MARAIDADKFIKIIELIDERYDLSGLRGVYPRRVLTRDGLIYLINRLPTIDPVKHGKWEEMRNAYGELEGWIHTECGREVKCMENFCPHCGARMDGD